MRRLFSSLEVAAFHYLKVGSGIDLSHRAAFSPASYRRHDPDVAVRGTSRSLIG